MSELNGLNDNNALPGGWEEPFKADKFEENDGKITLNGSQLQTLIGTRSFGKRSLIEICREILKTIQNFLIDRFQIFDFQIFHKRIQLNSRCFLACIK